MPQFIINVSGLDMLKLVTLFRRQRRATEIAHDLSIQKEHLLLAENKSRIPSIKRDRTALAPDSVQLFLGLQNIATTY
ncbi:TPA: hypothetical protein ACU3DF_001560 [Salmonella enterica]|nr:hypothetical protein [Salmonella enterica]EBH0091950.1 hypothetical protein [Salmonella enterica subsp. enterica serovar Hadar]ECQ3325998.1 hypothetical protein [Salmonella enterica]EEA8150085.1 hypothetical protein [Salmonella enterica subsp. enterica serovar Hadar]EEO4941061.1 hypothetical protein [Salmonella enterica]EEP1636852.1 hypothetical protein [Salmonella enterica]